MNNLKRVLSLALSGIMLVGMMAMGASAADFSDADTIEHADAVNILVALNVINGQDDGSFNPTGDVTRGQMAKMIAVAMNGGRDTNTGVKTSASFTDIKGHWAESYIEYCADMGIINGRGDGTFDPDGNVTGLEATKMVLTALGYESEAYKLTGASWAVRTDELAKKADPNLYEDLGTVVMANKASRDTAAQLIWNGLQNTTKRVNPLQNTNTGEVTFQYGDGDVMLKERYGADVYVGTFEGNSNTLSGLTDGYIRVNGKLDGATSGTPGTFPSDFDIAYVGEEVKVVFKDSKDGMNGRPSKGDTIYGVFVTGATTVLNVTANEVEATDADDDGKVKIDGAEYDVAIPTAGDVLVEKNFGAEPAVKAAGADADALEGAADAAFEALAQKNGSDKIKFILDDEGKVTNAYVTSSVLGKVTSKNSTKVNISGLGTIELAKNEVYDGIAKDDIVVFTKLYNSTAADAYVIVEKAEKVSGEITGYKNSKKTVDNSPVNVYETVTVDGTTYKILKQETMGDGVVTDGIDNFGAGMIGEDFDLYMVGGYVAAAVQTSESASNYSLVTDIKSGATAGSVFDGLQVQLMAADGTKTIHTVSKSSEDVVTGTGEDGIKTNDYPKGTIVTYTLDSDGNAKLKAVGKLDDASSNKGYVKQTKSFNGEPTTASCVLFVSTSATGDYKAYNIRDLGDVTVEDGTKNFAVVKDGDNVVAVYVDLKDTPKGATSTTVYGIVSSVDGTIKDGSTEYNVFTVSVGGEDVTVKTEANSGTDDSLVKGTIYKFDPSSDDKYSDNTGFTAVADNASTVFVGWVKSYNANDKLITLWSAIQGVKENGDKVDDLEDEAIVRFEGKTANAKGTMVIDDDADIYYVDAKGAVSFDEGSIPTGFDTMTGYKNVIAIGKDEGEVGKEVFVISTLIVEVGNEQDIVK